MARGALAAAVEAAANEAAAAQAAEATEEGTVVVEMPEAEVVTPSPKGAEAEVKPVVPVTEAVVEDDEEPPMEYFGTDLSGLPADQRRELIAQWSERDKRINQLQRDDAEAEKVAAVTPAAEPEAEAPAPLTDEALQQALGLDMEDEMDAHAAKTAVPLARLLLDLKDQVETLSSGVTATSEQTRWEGALTKLEADYGPLPMTREVFLAGAVQQRITDPVVAYWAAVGPARIEFQREVEKRLAAGRVAGAKGATTPRPKGEAAVAPGALKSTNVRDATKEAAELAAKELGIDWGSAWDNR